MTLERFKSKEKNSKQCKSRKQENAYCIIWIEKSSVPKENQQKVLLIKKEGIS